MVVGEIEDGTMKVFVDEAQAEKITAGVLKYNRAHLSDSEEGRRRGQGEDGLCSPPSGELAAAIQPRGHARRVGQHATAAAVTQANT